MKRIILTWLVLCTAVFGGWQTSAIDIPHFKLERLLVTPANACSGTQISLTGAGQAGCPSGGGSPPSVTSSANNSPGVSSVTIPTINAGDVVVIAYDGYAYTTTGATATSAHLTFNTAYYDSANIGALLWAYNSGGALTNEVVSLTPSGVRSLWGVSLSGVNTSSPFDSVGVAGATTSNSGSLSIATTHAADAVFGELSNCSTPDGSPWSTISQTAYGATLEYRQVNATNTYTASFGGGTGCSGYMFAIRSP
jgi:hypothetical protein